MIVVVATFPIRLAFDFFIVASCPLTVVLFFFLFDFMEASFFLSFNVVLSSLLLRLFLLSYSLFDHFHLRHCFLLFI
jgi:hypothetical protein